MEKSRSVEIAPLRSLNDFLLSSARFQLPNFQDSRKWTNRVHKNLVYYQSNYFLSAILIFLVVGFLHPLKIIVGLGSVMGSCYLYAYLTENQQTVKELKKNHPLILLVSAFFGGFMIVYIIGSVLVVIAGIILPIIIALIHASLRERNLANKLENFLEKKTPMGVLLKSCGLALEEVQEGGEKKVWKQAAKGFGDIVGSTSSSLSSTLSASKKKF